MKTFFAPMLALSVLMLFASCNKLVPNQKPEVEAGNNIVIQLPVDSIFLSATVKDLDDELITFMWKEVSGNDIPVIVSPGSLSTWVKGLKEGTYVFQLTATDNNGATGTDTVTIVVAAPDIISVTFNPHNNENEVHLFGNNTGLDQKDPNAPELVGGSGTYYGDRVGIRALLQFNLDLLPANVKIYKAKLSLYSNPTPLNGHNNVANSGTNNALYIQRVTSGWNKDAINWMNQPLTTTDDQILIPHTDEEFLDLIDLDVTKLVTDILASQQNNGFLIRLKNENALYNFRVFCSSKYPDATKHPKLEILYHL